MSQTVKFSFSMFAWIVLTACQAANPLLTTEAPAALSKAVVADLEQLAQLGSQIERMAEDRSCNSDAECRSIAFGVKPCGGPWSYLIYSTATVDAAELESMVEAYNALNARLNEIEGWASDCQYVLDPGPPDCLGGSCVGPSSHP